MMFNAVSPLFGNITMTWRGTIASNAAIILFSLLTVELYEKINRKSIKLLK